MKLHTIAQTTQLPLWLTDQQSVSMSAISLSH